MGQRTARHQSLPSLAEARGAVGSLGERFVALLRSAVDADRPAVGHWTVGDVAAHVSHVFAFDALSASGVTSFEEAELPDFIHDPSVLPSSLEGVSDFDDVNRMNEAVLRQDPQRDLEVLAERIERSLAELADTFADRHDTDTITWLGGARLPLVAIAGHALFELDCHGLDIARATERPWKIEAADVPLIFDGFVGPFLTGAPQIATAVLGEGGPAVCIELRFRGQSRSYLVSDAHGVRVERSNGRSADLHMSADPVAFLLIMSGRTGRLRSALTGRVAAWGRHPVRAMRLLSRLRTP